MAVATETRTFNTLMSLTLDAYSEEGGVNMLTSFPLVDLLYRRGRAKMLGGGARIRVPLRFGYNPGAQWYSGADVLDMTPFEIDTVAFFDWKQLHAPITYTGEEIRKNRGEYQVKDLVREKIRATEETLWKVLEIAMLGDGTANNGKVILGLDAFFPTAPTADPAVGAVGITAVGNPWWQNYAVTSFGSFAANGPAGTSADAWLSAWNTISDGPDGPDLILSSQDVWEYYNRALVGQSQIIMNQNSRGDLTFPSLAYNGVTWIWSRQIPDGRAYFLRTKDLEFRVHPEGNMDLSEWVKAFNQDLYGASMLVMCVFFIKRRIFTAVIDGVTA
jgi:hypothetical protein